jgi:hypothetical protein
VESERSRRGLVLPNATEPLYFLPARYFGPSIEEF